MKIRVAAYAEGRTHKMTAKQHVASATVHAERTYYDLPLDFEIQVHSETRKVWIVAHDGAGREIVLGHGTFFDNGLEYFSKVDEYQTPQVAGSGISEGDR